jgi:hypothetical protein
MIDPSIALSYKPVQIANPLDSLQQAQNIKQMAENTRAVTLENAERQRAQAAQAALNDALKANSKPDPMTQAPVIDYDGVGNMLTKQGFGKEALALKQHVSAMKEADLNLQKLNDEMRQSHAAHVSSLLGTVLDAPEAARPAIYLRVLDQAQKANYIKPGEMPAQYTPDMDPQLSAMRDQALSVQGQYNNKFNEARIGAAETTAQAAVERAAAAQKHWDDMQKFYEDKLKQMQDKIDHPDSQKTDLIDGHGNPLSYNPKTDTYKVHSEVKGVQRPGDENPDAPGKGRQQTPDNLANQQKANQADYERSANEEGRLRTLRAQLATAIRSGKYSVQTLSNGTTKVVPYASGQNGNEMAPEAVEAAKANMIALYNSTSTRLKQVTANKNDAMQRNNVQPGVPTDRVHAAIDSEDQALFGKPASQPGATAAKPAAPISGKSPETGNAVSGAKPAAPAAPLKPKVAVKAGSKGVAPRAKVLAYAKAKNIPFDQAAQEFTNFGYQVGQ